MIPNLYFDEETREFSNFDDQDLEIMDAIYGETEDKKPNKFVHALKTNRHVHAGMAAAGLGTAGTLIARKMAKKKALEMGLIPGSPEYKKFIRKYMAIGAGAGVAVGAAGAYGGHAIAAGAYAKKRAKEDKDFFDSLTDEEKKVYKKAAREEYRLGHGGKSLMDKLTERKARKNSETKTESYYEDDIENYLFSNESKNKAPYKSFKDQVKTNAHLHAIAGGAVGAGLGTGIGYALAKKAAIKAGLQPGTPEFKRFVRKRMAAAAAIGVAGGVGAAYGGHAIAAEVKARKHWKKESDHIDANPNSKEWKDAKKSMLKWKRKQYWKNAGWRKN